MSRTLPSNFKIRTVALSHCFSATVLLCVTLLPPAALASEDEKKKEAKADLQQQGSNDLPAKMIIEMETGETDREPRREAQTKLSRWLEVETLSISIRYQFIRNSAGVLTSNQIQHQETIKGFFKIDERGKYTIHAGLFPGATFQGSWNSTGLGTPRPRTNLYLKQLYLSAEPFSGVEFQIGSLYFARGQSTEITTYDNDGYIEGERLRITRPKLRFIDELSVTSGYVGDLTRPNINKRYHRMTQSNYHQVLLSKRIGDYLTASVDYTSQDGEDRFHQGLKLTKTYIPVIDSILVETFERARGGFGLGVYTERRISGRISIGAGYARLDMGGLNSDRFPKGKRIHIENHVKLSRELSVTASFTRAVGSVSGALPLTRLDLALNYNLLETIKRSGLF